jgi:hypothetical protein
MYHTSNLALVGRVVLGLHIVRDIRLSLLVDPHSAVQKVCRPTAQCLLGSDIDCTINVPLDSEMQGPWDEAVPSISRHDLEYR